jgi:phosphohistidine phosphatase
MKKLVLIRHAKSEWANVVVKDFDRSLNTRGFSDAPKMGLQLKSLTTKPDLVISSPAERTRLTAQLVLEQIGFDLDEVQWNEEVYEASARTLMNVVNAIPDEFETVWMFGHNPGFSYLAEYLTAGEVGDIPTCGVFAIEFELDSWALVSQNTGHKSFYIYPKLEEGQED